MGARSVPAPPRAPRPKHRPRGGLHATGSFRPPSEVPRQQHSFSDRIAYSHRTIIAMVASIKTNFPSTQEVATSLQRLGFFPRSAAVYAIAAHPLGASVGAVLPSAPPAALPASRKRSAAASRTAKSSSGKSSKGAGRKTAGRVAATASPARSKRAATTSTKAGAARSGRPRARKASTRQASAVTARRTRRKAAPKPSARTVKARRR
jgi:hypothetical protein